nr:hypothetical protein [Tanacetum cinerariifolium]
AAQRDDAQEPSIPSPIPPTPPPQPPQDLPSTSQGFEYLNIKDSLGLKHLYLRGCWSDKRLRKNEMQMNMLKMLLLVMMLKEMILLLMEKFILLLKNHPYHLLPPLFHHHNHLKISLRHIKYNKHHPNHLRLQKVDTSDDNVMDDESNQGRMIDEMDKDDVVVLMDEKEEDKKVEEAKVDESAQV